MPLVIYRSKPSTHTSSHPSCCEVRIEDFVTTPDHHNKESSSPADHSTQATGAAPILTEEPALTPPRPPPKPSTRKRNAIPGILTAVLLINGAILFDKSPALAAPWPQSYDPAHSWLLSAALAALPLIVLLVAMAGLRIKGHIAALAGLATALAIALISFHMPIRLAFLATGYGAPTASFPSAGSSSPYSSCISSSRARAVSQCCRGVLSASRATAASSLFSSPSASAPFLKEPPASALLSLSAEPCSSASALPRSKQPASLYSQTPRPSPSELSASLSSPCMESPASIPSSSAASPLASSRPSALSFPFWLIWAFAGFSRCSRFGPPFSSRAEPTASHSSSSQHSTDPGWWMSSQPPQASSRSFSSSVSGNRAASSTSLSRRSRTTHARLLLPAFSCAPPTVDHLHDLHHPLGHPTLLRISRHLQHLSHTRQRSRSSRDAHAPRNAQTRGRSSCLQPQFTVRHRNGDLLRSRSRRFLHEAQPA